MILEIEELLLDYGGKVSGNEDNLELATPLSKEIVDKVLSTLRDEVLELKKQHPNGMTNYGITLVENLLNKP